MCGFSQEEIKKKFYYDPDTGEFRLASGGNTGYIANTGYLTVAYCGNHYLAHRLIFIIMTGDFPLDNVDHINRVKLDNRWCNLRDVPQKLNMRNLPLHGKNKTGHAGVYKQGAKWRAQIHLDNRCKHLGIFDTIDEAVQCRREAEEANGFINSKYARDLKA